MRRPGWELHKRGMGASPWRTVQAGEPWALGVSRFIRTLPAPNCPECRCQEGQTRILIDKPLADVAEGSRSRDAAGAVRHGLRHWCDHGALPLQPHGGMMQAQTIPSFCCSSAARAAENGPTQWAEAGGFIAFAGEQEWSGRNDTRLAAVAGPIGPGSQRIPVSARLSLPHGALRPGLLRGLSHMFYALPCCLACTGGLCGWRGEGAVGAPVCDTRRPGAAGVGQVSAVQ